MSFNAEVHREFLKTVFEFYDIYMLDWSICFIADNARTSIRLARICNKPHVGCNSHKLNLEVNSMVSSHLDLKRTIDCVRDTMKSAKVKLKNAAILRNITELVPITDKDTRWSGMYRVLSRFDRLRDYLLEASDEQGCELSFNSSNVFAAKNRRYARMLGEINQVTLSLQKEGHSLADCRDDLDALLEAINEEKRFRK